jgi:hypothetical protein
MQKSGGWAADDAREFAQTKNKGKCSEDIYVPGIAKV